jgi:hypothetical protein
METKIADKHMAARRCSIMLFFYGIALYLIILAYFIFRNANADGIEYVSPESFCLILFPIA